MASVVLNDRILVLHSFGGVIRMIGLTTYPYYLLHEIVGGAALYKLLSLNIPFHLSLAISLLSVGGVACVIARWGEPVLQSFLRRSFLVLTERTEPAYSPPEKAECSTPQCTV